MGERMIDRKIDDASENDSTLFIPIRSGMFESFNQSGPPTTNSGEFLSISRQIGEDPHEDARRNGIHLLR